MDEILGRLSEYFAGARRSLQLGYDLREHELDTFARKVLRQTARIRYGDTRTYQQIAKSAGRPNAYRNVLAILTANPLPIVIPCHRVVTAKSGVGSYIAGVRKKEWLLKMEARAMASGQILGRTQRRLSPIGGRKKMVPWQWPPRRSGVSTAASEDLLVGIEATTTRGTGSPRRISN